MSKVVIKDREWQRIKRELSKKAARAVVKIGILAGKASERHADSPLSMVEIGAIHEFGSPAAGIKERSYIRKTFDDQQAELNRIMKVQARKVINGHLSVALALGQIGAWGAAAVKATIAQGPHLEPALAASTVAKRVKNSTRPLLDTGQLVGSISFEVEE